jgi:hypothetical protein
VEETVVSKILLIQKGLVNPTIFAVLQIFVTSFRFFSNAGAHGGGRGDN